MSHDGQGGHEVEFLVDDGDAGAAGVERIAEWRRPAVDVDACRARAESAPASTLMSVLLPAPFSPEQRQHFAGVQGQIDAAQRVHAGIRFGDAVHRGRSGVSAEAFRMFTISSYAALSGKAPKGRQ